MKIKEIFEKPIDRRIEEVIKVTQVEESVVHDEISEYVVTDAIKEHFTDILRTFSEAPSSPHEGIGIWVSGFFGSGKSSFAKILGYILEGKTILKEDARNLFKKQVNDKKISDFLDYIKAKIPTKSIIFDVSMDRGIRSGSDRITEIMYKVLLRELGYAEDFDIAKLEQDLEEENRLDKFTKLYEKEYSKSWSKGRKRAGALNEASRILHLMEPKTYNQPDSWVKSLGIKDEFGNIKGRADVTPNKFAELAFELMAKRRKDTALVFVVDEVGQFVSRSVEKMLDLQAIVQALGVAGKNKVASKKAFAPTWLIVTSQEKLNEVVSALDDKRIELARLKDRFPMEIDLAPADIAEVTGKRVLTKKAKVVPQLTKLFEGNQHRLNQCTKLEHTSRNSETQKDEFVNLYPYLPYHIDLCIDIMSGIRLMPGAQRYIGGSNRTIIKQAQQMLINPRVKLADEKVGMLVTFDKVYDLIKDNLSSEKQRDIISIERRFSDDHFIAKVAKAVCLLEFVKDLPRTIPNISAVLYSNVEAKSCAPEVEKAVKKLEKAQFIKFSDDGYKLLTVQEKNWDIKRNDLSPKPADRNMIRRKVLEELFGDSKATHFNYKGLKTFRNSFVLDGNAINDKGDVEVELVITDDMEEFKSACEEKKKESRHESNKNKIFWVLPQNEEIHRYIDEFYRSNEMIRQHERLASQGQLSSEAHKCFSEEKIRKDKTQRDLRKRFESAAYSGAVFFKGVKKDVSAEGRDFFESIKALLNTWVPELFPKFTLGAKHLSGKEAQNILTAINLSGLPSVFYEGKDGFGIVVKHGEGYVVNANAEISQEIMRYINEKHSYGEKVTGKLLESYFGGIGYGWERDVLRLVLATLFRAGTIEVGYQGKRYKNYSDHMAREAIVNNNAFKVSTFAPREKTIPLQHIKNACLNYEAITGNEVDTEENKIEQALKELAIQKKDNLLSLDAKIRAYGLPCKEFVNDLLKTMIQLPENSSDDCIKYLAEEGKELKVSLEKVAKIHTALSEDNLVTLNRAKNILSEAVFVLKQKIPEEDKLREKMDRLKQNIESEDFYDRLNAIAKNSEAIASFYTKLYEEKHVQRNEIYKKLEEFVKGLIDWKTLPEDMKNSIMRDIDLKRCSKLDLGDSLVCANCRATMMQMESDISAKKALEQQAQQTINDLIVKGNENIEKIKLSDYFEKNISTPEEFKEQLEKFVQHVEGLLNEGKKIIFE